MRRQTIKELRRAELISAAISAIHQHGFADLTVSQIAKDAETSTGSIHYYFGGKEALLEATMRHLMTVLSATVRRRLRAAEDPRRRLNAMVVANFDEAFFSQETCTVWTQFWAYAPYNARLSRLQRMNKARVRSNLNHELRALVPDSVRDQVRFGIQSYMDGVWVHAAQASVAPTPETAQQDAAEFLSLLVDSDQPRPGRG
ncbi:MAG: choline-responsive transcriptional repressor BetI [Paracoccaceae bacterium]